MTKSFKELRILLSQLTLVLHESQSSVIDLLRLPALRLLKLDVLEPTLETTRMDRDKGLVDLPVQHC